MKDNNEDFVTLGNPKHGLMLKCAKGSDLLRERLGYRRPWTQTSQFGAFRKGAFARHRGEYRSANPYDPYGGVAWSGFTRGMQYQWWHGWDAVDAGEVIVIEWPEQRLVVVTRIQHLVMRQLRALWDGEETDEKLPLLCPDEQSRHPNACTYYRPCDGMCFLRERFGLYVAVAEPVDFCWLLHLVEQVRPEWFVKLP